MGRQLIEGTLPRIATALEKIAEYLKHTTEPDKQELNRPPANTRQIEAARAIYADLDDVEIDDDAVLSITEDGVWVAAWVWVPSEEIGDGKEATPAERP